MKWIAFGEAVPGEDGWYPTLWDGEPDEPAMLLWRSRKWHWGDKTVIEDQRDLDRIIYWFPLPEDPRGPAF